MKKSLVLLVALLLVTAPALGFMDHNEDNSTNQDQGQAQGQGQQQGQAQGQGQGQGQGQMQGQAAIAAQGQMQGQVGIQGNEQGTSVNVDASEDNDYNALAYAPPMLNPVKGMKESQINSLFGGLGFSQTEEYSTCAESIKLTVDAMKAGILDKEEAKAEYLKAKAQYLEATAPKRVLFFGPKTRGQHVGNLLGFASMDDGYKIWKPYIDPLIPEGWRGE